MSDENLLQIFLEETQDNLQIVEEGLLELENSPEDMEIIHIVFRAMHTIKGGAGLMGLSLISEIAHHLENILEEIRQAGRGLEAGAFSLLFTGTDLLTQMLKSGDVYGEQHSDQIEDLLHRLQLYDSHQTPGIVQVNKPKNAEGNKFFRITLKFRQEIFETGTDPLMLLLEVAESAKILESYVNITELPSLYRLESQYVHIYWTLFVQSTKTKSEIEDIFIFVRDENEIKVEDITGELDYWLEEDKKLGELLVEKGLVSSRDIQEVLKKQKLVGELLVAEGKITPGQVDKIVSSQLKTRSQEQSSTIRVDTHKLEALLNYIAELLISQARVRELVTRYFGLNRSLEGEIFNAFQEVDKIIRRLQEEVMNASMVPIGATFTRFHRMARDLAQEKGKEVEVIISGKETELDKKVIEQISDPLKHLIRNSIDHGLELPEERLAAGKPPKGTVQLNAFHQEGSIVIEVSDDGRGIDEEAVLAKAVEKGLVEPHFVPPVSEIHRMLFLPGFSTAKEVTDISGRGVGLDVVMTNIYNLQGRIDLQSQKGKGTKFTIKLPLTLAIIDGMMVRVGAERFIIPLTAVIEFIKAKPEDIRRAEGKGLIVHLRQEYLPFSALYQVLGLKPQFTNPADGLMVILKEGHRKLALLVDEIIGQEQVVIKSIKDNLDQVEGIAGATILGDGQVAIILDISSFFKLVKARKTS